MFKKITGFFVKKKDKAEKRKLSTFESLIVIVILGIIIILAGSYLAKPTESKNTTKEGHSWKTEDVILHVL